MKNRIFSSIAIFLILIVTILVFKPLFYILAFSIAAIMLMEWYEMTKTNLFYVIIGLVIVPLPIISLLIIASLYDNGWLLFTYFMIIATVDVLAMLGGKLIRGPKLAPRLSPNKTISGFTLGSISTALVPIIFSFIPKYFPEYDISQFIDLPIFKLCLYAIFLGILAQMSDLFISMFKRKFKIKDTGCLIPGHGGVLDRYDSIIFTAPILLIYLHLNHF